MMISKTVWITGASSGIGEALAYEFAKEKATLILSSRSVEKLQHVKSICDSLGAQTFIIPIDLTNPQSITEAFHQLKTKTDRIDVLVNNGGISQRSWVIDTPIEIDRKMMEVDYFGHVFITKLVLPMMINQKGGNIIVISSLSGKFGVSMRSAYCAAKHALLGFFETVRIELHKENIKVLNVCPGRIKTNISYHAITESGGEHGKMDDGQKFGMPVEIAAKKIMKAYKNNKKELIIGGKEVLMAYFKRFVPGLFYVIMNRVKAE